MQPSDTSPAALARQHAAFRSLTPQERLRIADEMSSDVRQLVEAGVRFRHPEYSAEERAAAVAQIYLGRELASRVRARSAGQE